MGSDSASIYSGLISRTKNSSTRRSKEKLMQTRKEFSFVVSPSGGIKGLIREINRAIKLKDKATKKKATEEKTPAA